MKVKTQKIIVNYDDAPIDTADRFIKVLKAMGGKVKKETNSDDITGTYESVYEITYQVPEKN